MNIELLKQGLQQILQEDLSNRGSISELRRNVFLQSSKSEEKDAKLAAKEKALTELVSEVDYFKKQMSIRENAFEENKQSFEDEKSSLMDVINSKENEIASLRTELESLSLIAGQLEEKNLKVNQLLLENSNYTSKIRELVEHIALLQEKDEAAKKEISSLKIKADWAENSRLEADSLSGLLQSEKESGEKLNQENSRLLSELEAGIQLISQLEVRLNQFNAEKAVLTDNLLETQNKLRIAEEIAIDLKSKQSQSNDELIAMDKSLNEVRKLNEELQASNFELLSKEQVIRISSEETIAVLKEELVQLEELSFETIDNLRSDNHRLTAELKELIEQRNNLVFEGKSPDELFVEFARLTEEKNALLSNVASIQSKYDEVKNESERLKSEWNEIQKEKQQLHEMNSGLESKIETLSVQLSEVQGQNQELIIRSNELQSINQTLSSFRENYISAQQKISELENTIRDLHSSHSSSVSAEEFNQLIARNEVLKTEIGTLQSQISSTSELALEIQSLSEKNTALIKEIDALKKVAEQQLVSVNQIPSEELQRENKRLSVLGDMLKKRVAELEKLNSELKNSSVDSLASEQKISQLQMLADELNAEKIRLEDVVTDLKRELFNIEERLSSATEASSSSADALSLVSAQKDELEKQVLDLLAKLSDFSKISENQNVESADLEKGKNSLNFASVLAVSVKNKKSVKLKINELLREIDRCIAMLNAQS